MLTQLISLSLTGAGNQHPLDGVSLLTNLHSFSWTGDLTALPWCSLSPLPSLTCLTVRGTGNNKPPVTVGGMTGLKVLDIEGTGCADCWEILNSLTAVNSITKLTCKDAAILPLSRMRRLTPLQSFTALQHLVLQIKCHTHNTVNPHGYDPWKILGGMTRLDIGWISVEIFDDQGFVWLLKTLRTMLQLTSLKLSFRVVPESSFQATNVLTAMRSLLCLVCLKELSILCHFTPYMYVQHAPIAQCLTKLQSTLQAYLEDAQVQVTPLGGTRYCFCLP